MTGAANTSNIVAGAMFWILLVSVILLVAVTGTMVYFAFFAYNRKRRPRIENIEGHLGLEILWTVLPLIIVMWIFWIGHAGYLPERQGSKDALQVDANGVMWA